MNPYFIKGPAQIGLSGGRTSGYMMRKILDAHNGTLPSDVHAFFQNTGKEVEETLVFIEEMSQRWGVPVVWMEWCREWGQRKDAPWYRLVDFKTVSRRGEPFDMMLDYLRQISAGREECAADPAELCKQPVHRLAQDKDRREAHAKPGPRSLGQHRRYSLREPRRYHRMMAANDRGGRRWEHLTPLYHDGVTKEQVLEFWNQQPFDLGIDSDLGNCDLCWKKSEDKLYRAIIQDPSRVLWWPGTEEKFGQVFRQDRPKYAHMGWYAERMATQDSFNFEAAGLVTEDIDCFCAD
ncbi:hypothetical protein [Pseudomonas nitroreducens]|uniref:hypothetical protein n=1 Tax=Pseudomonas nitroreducens TaxID=46680 RepID=UPI00265A7E28|nr:hypothetical protein [Pseudomonas nitroreducens]MCP1649451.1 hypothetical protein [Pseudomonas nitroreducens]MCP1684588.1 hypothetical protein [Pseudomonas nitroreducens]